MSNKKAKKKSKLNKNFESKFKIPDKNLTFKSLKIKPSKAKVALRIDVKK